MNCLMPFYKYILPSPSPGPVSSVLTRRLCGREAGEGRRWQGDGKAWKVPSSVPCPPFPQPALSVCYSARHDTNSGQEKKKQKVKYSQHPCSTFLVTRFKSLTFASPGLRFGCDTYKYFFNSWVQQQFELPTLGIWITIVFWFSKWIFNPSIP